MCVYIVHSTTYTPVRGGPCAEHGLQIQTHAYMMDTHVKGAIDTHTQAWVYLYGHFYIQEQEQVPMHMYAYRHSAYTHVYTGRQMCT